MNWRQSNWAVILCVVSALLGYVGASFVQQAEAQDASSKARCVGVEVVGTGHILRVVRVFDDGTVDCAQCYVPVDPRSKKTGEWQRLKSR